MNTTGVIIIVAIILVLIAIALFSRRTQTVTRRTATPAGDVVQEEVRTTEAPAPVENAWQSFAAWINRYLLAIIAVILVLFLLSWLFDGCNAISIKKLSNNMDSLNRQWVGVKDWNESLKKDVETVKADISTLKESDSKQNSRLDEFESRLAKVEDKTKCNPCAVKVPRRTAYVAPKAKRPVYTQRNPCTPVYKPADAPVDQTTYSAPSQTKTLEVPKEVVTPDETITVRTKDGLRVLKTQAERDAWFGNYNKTSKPVVNTREGNRVLQTQSESNGWFNNYRKTGGKDPGIRTKMSGTYLKEVPYKGGIRLITSEEEYQRYLAEEK